MMGALLEKIFGTPESARTDLDLPIEKAEFVVFDTELTGLDSKRDSVVSVGALRMTGGRIEIGNPFYRIVEPRTKLTAQSIVIHGITPSETEGRPELSELLPEFLEFCGERIIIGHHISMDVAFINAELKRSTGRHLDNPLLDTITLYRKVCQGGSDTCAYYDGAAEDANLLTLARKYDIPVDQAHSALGDAYMTAQLFQRFLSILQGRGISTVRDLLRVGKP